MNFISTLINFYEDSNLNTKEKYMDCFKLPIEYLESSSIQLLNKNIINDLELIKTKPSLVDDSIKLTDLNINNCEKSTPTVCNSNNEEYNLYYHVFNPTNIF